jgi:hypothetical protein
MGGSPPTQSPTPYPTLPMYDNCPCLEEDNNYCSYPGWDQDNPNTRLNNSRCDMEYNNADCHWDGGDCCEETCVDELFSSCIHWEDDWDELCLDPRYKTENYLWIIGLIILIVSIVIICFYFLWYYYYNKNQPEPEPEPEPIVLQPGEVSEVNNV